MTDTELDRIVAAAASIADAELEAFDFELAERELVAEIVATPLVPDAELTRPARGGRRWRRRRVLRIALVAGCLAAAMLVATLLFGSSGGRDEPAYAAEAIAVAEANRRLLVTEGGWGVYYASFQSTEYGEVGFEDERGIYYGGEYLDMSWYADERELKSRSRPDGVPVTIAGEEGYFYEVSPGDFVAVLPGPQAHGKDPDEPGSVLELGETATLIKGVAADAAAFRARLESIVSVDVDTWLAAMPPSVVQPRDQASEVDRILRGVPLPPAFDRSTIEPTGQPEDRYQLTAFVLRGAYCAWLDRWWFAQKAGDDATANAAIERLLDAEHWPAVSAQASMGSLDQDFRQYANTVARGDGDKDVYDQMENCIEY